MHGGKSVAGPEHPNWKGGHRSILRSSLPDTMKGMYDAVANDPNRIEMTAHLGVLNSILADSLSRINDGAPALFPKLREAWGNYRVELGKGANMNREALARHASEIEELINAGQGDYLAREDVRRTIQDIRRVSDTERKRMVDAEQMMSNDAVAILVTELISDVLDEVRDPVVQGRLHRRFAARLGAYRESNRERMQ